MSAKRPKNMTDAEFYRRLLADYSRATRVAMPARVDKFTAATATTRAMIDATPVFIEPLPGDEAGEPLPKITNIPILYPQSGTFYLRFPLAIGDIVLLVFCDKSLDKWLGTGGIVDPQDTRRHSLSDAFAVPGVFPHVDVSAIDTDDSSDLVMGMIGETTTAKIRIVAETGDVVVESGATIKLGSLSSAAATTTAAAVKNVIASLAINYLSAFMAKAVTLAGALVDSTGVDPGAKATFIAEINALKTSVTNDLIGKLDQTGGIAVSNTKVLVD